MPDAGALLPLIVDRRGVGPVIDRLPLGPWANGSGVLGGELPLEPLGRRDKAREVLPPGRIGVDHLPAPFLTASIAASGSAGQGRAARTLPSLSRISSAGKSLACARYPFSRTAAADLS